MPIILHLFAARVRYQKLRMGSTSSSLWQIALSKSHCHIGPLRVMRLSPQKGGSTRLARLSPERNCSGDLEIAPELNVERILIAKVWQLLPNSL